MLTIASGRPSARKILGRTPQPDTWRVAHVAAIFGSIGHKLSTCFRVRSAGKPLVPMAVRDGGAAARYRSPAADRPRRDGRHLPRHRRAARPRGRGQGARRALRARTTAIRERFKREALAAARLSGEPGRGHDLRRRRVGGAAVHRHGAPRRRLARGAPAARGRAASRRRRSRGSSRRRRRSTPRTGTGSCTAT